MNKVVLKFLEMENKLCLANEKATGCKLKNCNELQLNQNKLFDSNEETAQCMKNYDGLGF